MTQATDRVLMTNDEARRALIQSALRCLREATCGPLGLLAMLWGMPPAEGWARSDAALSAAHRAVLADIARAGHEWVVADELAGICSATGLVDGELTNVDAIAQVVDEDEFDTD